MPRKGHSEEQIVYALRQIEGGKKVSEVCREMGVSPQAVYRWKRRYGGLGLNEVRELRQLREVFGDSASDARDSPRSAPQLEHPGMRVTLLARTPSLMHNLR